MKKIEIVEVCPNCGEENVMQWDFERYGLNAFCPACGSQMMLCDECIHRDEFDSSCGSHRPDGKCRYYNESCKKRKHRENEKRKKFSNFLLLKNDEIDNEAFGLINALTMKKIGETVEWDVEIIGEVVDVVKDVLSKKCFGVCHPFYTNGKTPCYESDDCGLENCRFKKESEE